MSDFFHTLKTLNEPELKMWARVNPRKFRCHLCGHKFKAEDRYILVYTNCGTCGASGNPIMCGDCYDKHGGLDGLREAWKVLSAEWAAIKKDVRFWSFRKVVND